MTSLRARYEFNGITARRVDGLDGLPLSYISVGKKWVRGPIANPMENETTNTWSRKNICRNSKQVSSYVFWKYRRKLHFKMFRIYATPTLVNGKKLREIRQKSA